MVTHLSQAKKADSQHGLHWMITQVLIIVILDDGQ